MQTWKVEEGDEIQGHDGLMTSNVTLSFRDKKLGLEGQK
jgi:hypothetical protein